MDKIISRHKRVTRVAELEEDDLTYALSRSKEACAHLQDLLKRSDQKASFAVAGTAFLVIFVQMGNFNHDLATVALASYGFALIAMCITIFPHQWHWNKTKRRDQIIGKHLGETQEAELLDNCRQEADLRARYRFKSVSLVVGFLLLINGMAMTQIAVFIK